MEPRLGRTLQWLAALSALGWLVYLLRAVLSPVAAAFLIAYLFDPVVDAMEARRIPRSVGIVLILLVLTLAVTGFGLLVIPAIVRDLSALLATLPEAAAELIQRLRPHLASWGIDSPDTAAAVLSQLQDQLSDLGPALLGSARGALNAAALGTATVIRTLSVLLMVPILSFYLLADFDHIVARGRALLPAPIRGTVVAVVSEVDQVLGQFLRGQLLVMLILGLLYGAGYAAVGVPLAVPIGIVAGLLAFIPYVGGAVALGLALLMVALHFQGLSQLVAVIGVYSLIQVLEGFVITPRIVGDKLGLSPLWVLLALMAFGELFGFVGVMLALPAAAVVKVLVGRALRRYERSGLLDSIAPPPGPRAAAPPRLRRARGPLRRRHRSRNSGGAAH